MTYLLTSVSYWSYPHCCIGACLSFYAHLCLFYKTERPNIQCVHCHHIVYLPDGLFPFLVVLFVSSDFILLSALSAVRMSTLPCFYLSLALCPNFHPFLKSMSDFVREIRFWKSIGSWIFFYLKSINLSVSFLNICVWEHEYVFPCACMHLCLCVRAGLQGPQCMCQSQGKTLGVNLWFTPTLRQGLFFCAAVPGSQTYKFLGILLSLSSILPHVFLSVYFSSIQT